MTKTLVDFTEELRKGKPDGGRAGMLALAAWAVKGEAKAIWTPGKYRIRIEKVSK